MDPGDQAHWVKFMIRDRGSNFTAAFDAVLADAGIRTVLCNVRTPRMNAIAERWIGGSSSTVNRCARAPCSPSRPMATRPPGGGRLVGAIGLLLPPAPRAGCSRLIPVLLAGCHWVTRYGFR